MWTLILVLAINGSIFSEPHAMMTTIPGYTSKENCIAAGEFLTKENKKQASWVYHCIEVK